MDRRPVRWHNGTLSRINIPLRTPMALSRALRPAAFLVPVFALAIPAALLGAAPEWVARSNANAQGLLGIIAKYSPEQAGFYGMTGFDDGVSDLGPNLAQRTVADLGAARAQLEEALAKEADPQVKQ